MAAVDMKHWCVNHLSNMCFILVSRLRYMCRLNNWELSSPANVGSAYSSTDVLVQIQMVLEMGKKGVPCGWAFCFGLGMCLVSKKFNQHVPIFDLDGLHFVETKMYKFDSLYLVCLTFTEGLHNSAIFKSTNHKAIQAIMIIAQSIAFLNCFRKSFLIAARIPFTFQDMIFIKPILKREYSTLDVVL